MKDNRILTLFLIVTIGSFIGSRYVYAMNTVPSYTQDGYWFLDDDASAANAENETGYGTGNTAQNTNITNVPRNSVFMIRFDVSETANQDLNQALVWTLQYKAYTGTQACTDTSGWTQVTTSSTNAFQVTAAASITEPYAVAVDRISTETSSWFAGLGALLDTSISSSYVLDNKSGENQWAIQATSNATYEQAYIFRVSDNNSQTGLNSYTRCAQLTMESEPAEPAFIQNDFEWYVPQSSVTLTNIWPSAAGANLAENEIFTQLPGTNEALRKGDQIRVQMNITVDSGPVPAITQDFKLQYDAAEDCTAASGWVDVGDTGTASIWRLYDEASIGPSTTDVRQISTSTSSAEGYYSELIPSDSNPNEVLVTENTEWDWPLENNGATDNTTYCFRMVEGDGTAFVKYNSDSYPKLTTAPGSTNVMRHGNIFQGQTERGLFWAD